MWRFVCVLLLAFLSVGFFFHRRSGTVDLTTGLILYWAFDGDLLDSSPSGDDGTFNGGTATYTTGPPGGSGQAVVLSGTDQCVEDPVASNDALGDRSLSVWVNIDALTGTDRLYTSGTDAFRVYLRQTELDVWITSSGGTNFADSANSGFSTGSWRHVVVQRPSNGSNLTVYIDDVTQTMDDNGNNTPTTGANEHSAGGLGASCTSEVDGALCGLRVYNILLTAAQRTALFNRKCP